MNYKVGIALGLFAGLIMGGKLNQLKSQKDESDLTITKRQVAIAKIHLFAYYANQHKVAVITIRNYKLSPKGNNFVHKKNVSIAATTSL